MRLVNHQRRTCNGTGTDTGTPVLIDKHWENSYRPCDTALSNPFATCGEWLCTEYLGYFGQTMFEFRNFQLEIICFKLNDNVNREECRV